MFLRKFHENLRFCVILHGANLHFLSRITTSVFAGEIWLKISWGLISFHGRFLRHFYGRVHIFSGGNPKKKSRLDFFFTGKKNTRINVSGIDSVFWLTKLCNFTRNFEKKTVKSQKIISLVSACMCSA